MIEVYTTSGKQEFDSDTSEDYYSAVQNAYREDGPAVIGYYDNNKIEYEVWYLNGREHREDGPAVIWYFKNGDIERKAWYLYGEEHRENGPADIEYKKNGKIQNEEYWINGRHYSLKNWKKKLNIKESNIFESFKESYKN